MVILGIDPGSHRCGYGVVRFVGSTPQLLTHGCFDYPSKGDEGQRLVMLERDISDLCATHKPDVMCVESLFFNKNITTAMRVSEARGVILLAAAKHNVAVKDCTPLQVKMALTGYGRAEKSQIKHMVQLQFRNANLHKLDDAVDAIAVAITGHALFQHQKLTGNDRVVS